MFRHDRDVWISPQTLRVLEAFLDNPAEQLAGADVHRRTGLKPGTLYPILVRLERAGWFVSRWESMQPSNTPRRPRHRLYRLTPAGLSRAGAVLASVGPERMAIPGALSRGLAP